MILWKYIILGTNAKDAKKFFEILEKNKVRKIIDIRLNNINQLCDFTKKSDLEFFLKKFQIYNMNIF